MDDTDPSIELDTFESLKRLLSTSKAIDAFVNKKTDSIEISEMAPMVKLQLARCNAAYQIYMQTVERADLSDRALRSFCKYTDGLPLYGFRKCLQLVPALVNVVSVRTNTHTPTHPHTHTRMNRNTHTYV
jgi:hypothetical protein